MMFDILSTYMYMLCSMNKLQRQSFIIILQNIGDYRRKPIRCAIYSKEELL